MKALHMVSFILVVVGGLNWGIMGLGQLASGTSWNVVSTIAGYIGGATVENIIYVLVGLSAAWLLIGHKKDCRMCVGGGSM